MVAGSGNPVSIEIALETAKNAEKFLKENQERPEKLITAVANNLLAVVNKSPERNSRRWNQDSEKRGEVSGNCSKGKRSSTPFRKEGEFLCYNCQEEGHMARDCLREKKQGPKNKCYYCNKEGHTINKCYAKMSDEDH